MKNPGCIRKLFVLGLVSALTVNLSIGQTQTFTSSGTFTVPPGVTSILVECWGGGGGGGTRTSNGRAGGGGGGAYASSTLSVSPGQNYDVIVGSGGSANSNGGNSSFNSNSVIAAGGRGGTQNSTTGGAGGSVANSTGTTKYAGGNGANAGSDYSGGGGGGAGSTGSGGNAPDADANNGAPGIGTPLNGGNGGTGINTNSNGNSGSIYGGGGSGAKRSGGGTKTGGSGANGCVVISYCAPPVMGYDYERNIIIDHTKVAGGEDLYNFPMLFSATGQNFLKIYPAGQIFNSNGYDIVFTDENYNKLDHQIEYFNGTTGDLIAWIRIPILSNSTNTVIKILYGNSQISDDPSLTTVWDSHYKGVWHLDNNNLNDFTSYNKAATPSNSPTYPSGMISNSLELNGSNQYATVLNAPNTNFAGNITVSAWVYMDTRTRDQKIAGNQNNSSGGYKFGIYTNNKVEFEIRNSANNPSLNRNEPGGTTLNTGQWYYLAGQSSDVLDSIKTFVNGIPERPFKKTGILGTSSDNLTIGKEPFLSNYYFDGRFDELRISDKVRSNGWMRTEYFNQSSPATFYSIDDSETALNLLSASICSSPITLTFGYPSGGTYSGNPYISGNIFTPPVAGIYSITYTYDGSCGSLSITKDIIITPVPSAPSAPDKEYCSNQITYLEATSGENIRWYSGGTLVSTANPFSTGQTSPGTYTYTVTQSVNGCESPETTVTLTIYSGITIVSQPQPQTICAGDNATFSVTATGYNLSYQWQEDGVNISDGGIYSGTNTASLTLINPDNTKNNKQYRCVISASCGTSPVNTSAALLIINSGFEWTGAVNSDWNNPGNWTCAHIPGALNSVHISNMPNQPVLSTGGTGTVNNLTIDSDASLIVNGNILQIAGTIANSGTFDASAGTIELNGTSAQSIGQDVFSGNTIRNLIVNNNAGVTLLGSLNISGIVTVSSGILASDGFLTLLSDATQTALIDGAGAGEITGNVNMQRYLPSGFGYKYFSSPFQAAKVSQFSDDMSLGTTFSMFYRYDENRKLGGDPASGWVRYNYPDSVLNPLHGYSANFGSAPEPVTADITGTVNNGILSRTLYNNNNPYTLGFNLVGNPYPSPVDWDAPGWTKTNIDNAIHFFKASAADQYGGTYSSYIGGVSTDPGVATNIIPSMQGFFVHVSNGVFPVTGTLALDNSVRITDLSHSFIKSSKGGSKPLMRLNASFQDDPQATDPMVIYFEDNAETTFDSKFDALKLMNTDLSVPNLYTLGSDGSKLSIDSRPTSLLSGCMIPLGIKTSRTATIVISINYLDDSLPVTSLYLSDNTGGIIQDLLSGNQYSCSLPAGQYNDRFLLYINSSPTAINKLSGDDFTFLTYYSSGILNVDINSGEFIEGTIMVTNLMGVIKISQKIFEKGHHELLYDSEPGIYIVTLSSKNRKVSKKISVYN